ncbi:DUF1697 domain-containing protein [Pontibacter sp. H259]|uniref:DUF1697 domain-containing protein n=1 Tax=Pontibacter sp. H259 TaxID=3133421 RepID=UPI0030C56A27
MSLKNRYVAFLRGINVGGNHKVPMAMLKQEMIALRFENVDTLLNSGNVIFDAASGTEESLEETIASKLRERFGFAVPVLVRKADTILALIQSKPFESIEVTKDIRLYVSLLKTNTTPDIALPWTSADGSYTILEVKDKCICSVLDLAVAQTPKAMDALEVLYGKNLTTRNWNTIVRVVDKIAR